MRFILTQGPEYYVNFLLDNLTGVRAWYIVCCIISQTIFYFLQKWLGTGWKLGVAVVLLAAAGLTLTHFGVGDLFQFRTALICLFYLLIGYWLKKYEYKIFNIKIWLPIGMLCAYIALIVASTFIFQKRSLDVHMDKYYNIPYCFLLITVGCVALFLCASRIKKYPRWLVGIGRNTLVFYLHDTFWRGIAAKGLAILGISIPKTWYGALIWLTISCIGCGFEAYVLNKYFPEANGKTRKKKSKQVNA